MLYFLRHLRFKSLLKKFKPGNYLVYALGEIILVVIGILIALQINVWNGQKTDRKQELYILKRFLFDLVNDIDQLHSCIKETQIQLSNLDTIVSILNTKKDASRFFELQRSIHDTRTFKPNLGTYDESISSGKVELITNDSIRETLFNYYREITKYNADDAMNKIRDEIILPYINNTIYNRRESIGFIFKTSAQLPKLDLHSLSNDEKYFGILISAKGRHVQLINWSDYLNYANMLKKQIEKELLVKDG
ncbi:MAG: DUF6090 family protein [Bacteroidota bacterium]